MKTITFLMPGVQLNPSGGYKIVYEYANRLAIDGNIVYIINPATISFRKASLRGKAKALLYTLRFRFFEKFSIKWFMFENNVNNLFVWSLESRFIPESDIMIATGASTAFPLYKTNRVDKANKYYFIQGYETWAIGKPLLEKTYKLPLKKIVIADYLVDKVAELGENASLIYNGFDFDYFQREIPIENRDKYTIVMPYNKAKLKGCDVGFKALRIVHDTYPQLNVLLYGVRPPKHLPKYCTFYHKPQKEIFNWIYNTASIFLGPSYSEGFCLTVSEAMQCGCSIVCTNIGGYTVVCKNEQTALVGEVGNPQSLASLIIELIENDSLRFKIANNAYEMIQSFTWERAYSSLKTLLCL